MKKHRKNTCREAHTATKTLRVILLVSFFMLFSVGTVSAFEFDNKLTYSNNDMKVEVNNWFGFGTNYGSAELKSHKSVNEIKKVGTGNQIVMWYDFDFKEIYKNGLGNVEFRNETTGEIINRDYWFVYEDNITVNDTITEEIYKTLANGTKVSIGYKSIVVGNHQEKIWKPYNSKDIPSEKIRIGLKTFVEFGDLIDGVWTIGGKKVSKHSVWTNDLNPSLENYYKFDVINATLNATYNNITGTFDMDIVNDTIVPNRIVAGKIGNAFNFSSSNGCVGTIDDYGVIDHTLDLNDTFTLNWWYKQEAFVGADFPWVASSVKGGGAARIEFGINASGHPVADIRLTNNTFEFIHADRTVLADTFVMITFIIDDNNLKLYLNGTEVANEAINTNRDWTSVWVHFPNRNCHASGIFDELGVWIDRALTPTEITQLYNGGTGITWIPTNVVPTVTLNQPANDFVTFDSTVIFNATGIDDTNLVNMSLYVNESLISTNTSVFNNTLTQFSHTFSSKGFYNWTVGACDNLGACGNATHRNITFQNDLTVTLNQPINAFNSTSQIIIFNATGKDDTNLVNMSFILNATYNGTNSSVFNNTLTQFPRTLAEGFYNWTVEACDDIGICVNATARNFTIDTIIPAVNITSPFPNGTIINFQNSSANQTIEWTATDDNLDTCWIDYDFTNRTVTCNVNTSSFTLTAQRNVTFWANDTFGHENSSIVYWEYLILQNLFTFNASSFETETETFYVNITTNGTTPSSAELIYNGTTFSSATITNTAGNNYNISRTIDIPIVNGTKTFNFNVTVGGIEVNGSTQNQLINLTNFTHCVGETPVYINITFKNETVSEEDISAEIDSDWNYWLGAGGAFKTLSFTNVSENADYGFCLTSGNNRTLTANVSLTYDNSISQQRSFSDEFSLTNETTNQTLFLLPTTDGIFVTFQTVNSAEQVISNVAANVTKAGDLIAAGTTDDAGLVQYFLDPDTTYVFSFFKTGFALVTTTLKPTQTSYTITMGTIAAVAQNDTTRGISYIINPLANILGNNTVTEFNLTFTSTFWSLDSYGFALKNSTGTFFNITTDTTNTGGFLSRTLDTGNNTDILMEVFWTIDGNQTNVTRLWKVLDTTDEGFSIKTFFDDLSTYLTSGIFGLTSFGLGIIIFLIIIITTGVMSVKLGITNPAGLSIIVLALVLFFDVGLGIMPNPVGAVPNFPSIFVGVIFLGLLLKEAVIR